MKKFILAIVVAIAAVFPIASSAQSGDDSISKFVKAINDQNNPAVTAAWEAPYLIMNVKVDVEFGADLNQQLVDQLLADKETASMMKNMTMDGFFKTPEVFDAMLQLEKAGMKGVRFNAMDKVGAKYTLLITIADMRAYMDSKK